MSVSAFPYGVVSAAAAGLTVTLSTKTIGSAAISPATCIIGIYLQNDGQAKRNVNGSYIDISGEWLSSVAAGNGTGYSVRATEVSSSGTFTKNGTMNSWLALSTTREWDGTKSSGTGNYQWVIDLAISDDGGSTTLLTARITMDGERTI